MTTPEPKAPSPVAQQKPCWGCATMQVNGDYCPTCEAKVKFCEGKLGWLSGGGPRGRKFHPDTGYPWKEGEPNPWHCGDNGGGGCS